MVTAERIEIREIYEFQLYEQPRRGEPRPVGKVKRDLVSSAVFLPDQFEFDPQLLYAIKRRRIDLDEDGNPTYNDWEWITDWEPAFDRR